MEITFDVNITNKSGNSNSNSNSKQTVYAPRYHKPKEMSWWIILSDSNSDDNSTNDELLVLKRIGISLLL